MSTLNFLCECCQGVLAVSQEDKGSLVSCGHCAEATQVPMFFHARSLIGNFCLVEDAEKVGIKFKGRAFQVNTEREVDLVFLEANDEQVNAFVSEAREARAFDLGMVNGIYYYACLSLEDAVADLVSRVANEESLLELIKDQFTNR